MKKSLLSYSLSLFALIVFTGCNLDTSPPGASEYSLSGKVIDSVTGSGVSGAKVGFGSNILTTDASGNYSVTVKANETITGNFYVSKGTEYNFEVYSGINLTPVSDLSYDILIDPVDTSGYSTHTVSGKIFDNSSTEILNGYYVNLEILNENGGRFSYSSIYDSVSGGYSIDTETFGSACVLIINVNSGDPDYTPIFNYYVDNIDLSAATVPLDLTQPSSGYSTVTVTGVDGEMFMRVMLYSDSIYLSPVSGSLSGTTSDVNIYNPDSKKCVWVTMINQDNIPAQGDWTAYTVVSAASIPESAVTLPVPSLIAPTEAVLGSSVSYSEGTLSFTGNADLYNISLDPDEGEFYGNIMSRTSSVDLPNDIITIITSESDGYTKWDANITPINTSSGFSVNLFLTTQVSQGIDPGLEYVLIDGAASTSVDLIP